MRKEAREMLARVHEVYREVQLVKAESKAVDVGRMHELADNWKNDEIPGLQRRVIDTQLDNLRQGVIDPVFLAFMGALGSVHLSTFSFLDIGCASGYYSEVIRSLDRRNISYTGCDYSAAMIDCARQHYPDIEFAVQDVTSLTYPARAFDVVMASGVLQYIADYHQAIDHVLRVARHYAILHRLPVIGDDENEYVENAQYSIVTARTCFAKNHIIQEVGQHGFSLVRELGVYAANSPWGRAKRMVRGLLRAPEPKRSVETLVFRRRDT